MRPQHHKRFIPTLALIIITMSSCDKDRNCRCTTTDMEINTSVIVNVDRNIKCKHLLHVGIETLHEGTPVREVHPVSCEEVEPEDAFLESDAK